MTATSTASRASMRIVFFGLGAVGSAMLIGVSERAKRRQAIGSAITHRELKARAELASRQLLQRIEAQAAAKSDALPKKSLLPGHLRSGLRRLPRLPCRRAATRAGAGCGEPRGG